MVGATMSQTMGIKRVRLLTNNPDKVSTLTACGIEMVGREPHGSNRTASMTNIGYQGGTVRPYAGLIFAPRALDPPLHSWLNGLTLFA